MKKVHVENLKPGMKVARTVFSIKGNILLRVGVEVKDRYIQRLKDFNIPSIYVVNEATGELDVSEPLSVQTRVKALNTLKEFSSTIISSQRADVKPIKDVVYLMIDEILADPQAIVNLVEIRSYDDYTFAHSVQVALLCLLTGVEMELNEYQLFELGMGALLHDLGKLEIDSEILNKPGKLTREEFDIISKHPYTGFDILRNNEGINLLSAHVAYQHHERINGKGYPRGLTDDSIHCYGKIAACADVYDAITADRVYRRGILPHEAVKVLKSLKGIQFDEDVVDSFLNHIALYPVGSKVILNNGFKGYVIDVNRNNIESPIVRLTETSGGKQLESMQEVDLAKEDDCYIIKVINVN